MAGKGDTYRKVNRNKFDTNYISIVWNSSNSKKEIANESECVKSRKSSYVSK